MRIKCAISYKLTKTIETPLIHSPYEISPLFAFSQVSLNDLLAFFDIHGHNTNYTESFIIFDHRIIMCNKKKVFFLVLFYFVLSRVDNFFFSVRHTHSIFWDWFFGNTIHLL